MSDALNIPFRRVSELPAAGALAGTDLLQVVRPGNPANPLLGLVQALVDLVVPQVTPLVLASVGIQEGTVTGTSHNAGVTTYTYTSAVETPDFGRLTLVFPETNQGTVQVARTSGATRGVQHGAGSAMTANLITPGKLVVLQRRGSQFWVEELDLIQHFISRVNLIGGTATLDGQASRGGTVMARISGMNTGRILFQTRDGEGGALTSVLDLQATGVARVLTRLLNAGSEEYFHPGNRPAVMRQIAEALADVVAPVSSRQSTHVTIDSAVRRTVGGRDRAFYVVGTAGLLDVSGMYISQTIDVDVAATATLTLVTPPGSTWRGTAGATQLAIPADSSLRVRRNQGSFEAERRQMFTTTAAVALAAPSLVLPIGGQSYAVDAGRHALPGLQDGRTLCGLTRSVRTIEGVAFGASCFLSGVPGQSDNHLWNQVTGLPGPNYPRMLAALQADPDIALVQDVAWMHFLNDMENFGPTGDNTPATMVTAIRAFVARLRTDLGKPTLRFHFCAGPPSQPVSETLFPSNRWGAMRRAVLDAVAGQANMWIAPPFYDLALPYAAGETDRHAGFVQLARWGQRFALHLANVVNGQSNWLGPVITGFAEESGGASYAWTVDVGTGRNVRLPQDAAGFRLLPPGTHLFDTPLEVVRAAWSGGASLIFRQFLAVPTPGARPVYPWGPLEEMQDPETIVRAQSPLTGDWMPLREYRP